MYQISLKRTLLTCTIFLSSGNKPLVNYQVYHDTESLKEFAVLVNMYRALAPYTTVALAEIASKGLPMQRPLFLHYEEDPKACEVEYQYLYGRDILVAPVLESGVATKEAYLPLGDTWVHLFTGEEYEGGNMVTVNAPLGYPPVFYSSDSEFVEVFKKLVDIREGRVSLEGKSEL